MDTHTQPSTQRLTVKQMYIQTLDWNLYVVDICTQKQTHTHLSISPYGASAVSEQLRHVVVAGELPETGLQVEVSVEAQRAVPPQSAAELIGRRVPHALGAAHRGGDEAVTGGDLVVVEQVRAAVVPNPGSVRTESQVKVHEGPGGDYRKHACEGERERGRETARETERERDVVIPGASNYL